MATADLCRPPTRIGPPRYNAPANYLPSVLVQPWVSLPSLVLSLSLFSIGRLAFPMGSLGSRQPRVIFGRVLFADPFQATSTPLLATKEMLAGENISA